MIYLFLTIFCSTSIALILKQNDVKKGEPLVLLSANYFVCAIISLVYVLNININFNYSLVLFGIMLGALFVLAFFAFAKAVSLAGTALATVSSRLSVIVPIIFTILIYNEIPSVFQITGIVLALFTIYLFYLSIKNNNNNKKNDTLKYLYLIGVLVGIGINDFCMKVFREIYTEVDKPLFLLSIFGSAFVYSFIFILLKKLRIDRKTVVSGLILGIPNVYSTYFLIGALSQLPAILVYPVINIGIIIFTAVLAAMIFKEKLNRYSLFSLFVGIIAIIFLSF